MANKKLLTGAEFAQLLGIGSPLFYKLNRENKIPIKPAVGKYFSRIEAEAWINAGCPEADVWDKLRVDALTKGGA
jgi:predicted DNA-binding transcriptional regulator AlpA